MLSINGLTKRFGGFTAVNNVSFDLAEGEILGLIGPNGSGKSTSFNLIAGSLSPTAGSIKFLGQEIGGLPPDRICHRGIGRTYQIPRPFKRLSLLENVAGEMGAKMSAMDNATRNAGEMIDKLTITYNRQRQAQITKELIEIISGAEAL